MHNETSQRLVVVSNRLPISLTREGGEMKVKPGAGGLVSALAPVLRDRGGLWIGWSGTFGDEEAVQEVLDDFSGEAGYGLRTVNLTEEEIKGYYYGFANEVLWPLFHDFQSRCVFRPTYWRSYLDVNLKFAETIARDSREGDYLWIHDYHLMHVAFILRSMGVRRKMGFFLHIPFPPIDIFLKLPWRDKIIRALLAHDLVGLHTSRDVKNFLDALQTLVPEVEVTGEGRVVTLSYAGRTIRLGSFPIGIDFDGFDQLSHDPDVTRQAQELRTALQDRTIVLGVDRLDYTKGIPQRIEAIRQALVRFEDLREQIVFIQIAVPSRTEIPEYQALKAEIEGLVGEVNGQFSRPGWTPIQYQFRSLPRPELISYYRAADVAMVTPLRDGMNLVAKEYCACQGDGSGVLFLSEFAGAAAQLQKPGAVLVNPYDVEGVARALRRVVSGREKHDWHRRMQAMRTVIKESDIFWWVDSFLETAFSTTLKEFPAADVVDYSQEAAQTEESS